MQWYYSKNGTQLGPIGTEEIQSKLASAEIAQSDLIWKDGMADWLPAGQISELRTAAPASTVAIVQPVAPAETSPYHPPVAVQSAPQVPTKEAMPGAPLSQGFAIGSMICGIIAVLTCCMWCLSGPLAIVAVVLGHIAISKIKTEPAKFGGKGLAKTGLITGYFALLLTLLVTILSFWAKTLSPEKIEQMEFLPKEMREEMQKQREQKNPTRIETP